MLEVDPLVRRALVSAQPTLRGRVQRVGAVTIDASLPGARVGDLVRMSDGTRTARGEVVAFQDGRATIVSLDDPSGLGGTALVTRTGTGADVPVGTALLGRTIDAFGNPLDGRPRPAAEASAPLRSDAPAPGARRGIDVPLETGVGVVDGLLTLGVGQRVGLFAGAGVGKTTLVQQIAHQARCDVKVIALVGERGCEARDVQAGFAADDTVVVVATSDRSPLERTRAALAATSIAEHFRDEGAEVLLVLDSLTRYAMALREIGLAAGELPATKGYPPSVFAQLPRLLERAAPLRVGGSITGVYTVLVEGDDLSDPVADSARSLLDGHIVLSRGLAMRGHFPAVDVLASASRVMHRVCDRAKIARAQRTRTVLAQRAEAEELRSLGAYVPGQNPEADRALATGRSLDRWAAQDSGVRRDAAASDAALESALSLEPKENDHDR